MLFNGTVCGVGATGRESGRVRGRMAPSKTRDSHSSWDGILLGKGWLRAPSPRGTALCSVMPATGLSAPGPFTMTHPPGPGAGCPGPVQLNH